MLPRRVAIAVSAGVTAACVLAGCSKASKTAATPSASGSSGVSGTAGVSGSGAASPSTSTASTSPSVSVSVSEIAPASFNGTCGSLIPVSLVNMALGRLVVGTTAFVVGVAEPNIGRLTYLNCRYGIPAAAKGKPAPTPTVEIGVSLYSSAAQATSRLQGTIEDYLSNGAAQSNVTAGSYSLSVLTGYHDPTVVGADGQRTVAVTVRQTLLSGAPATGLTALAKAVLDSTANFTPGTGTSPLPVSPAPSGPSAVGSPVTG